MSNRTCYTSTVEQKIMSGFLVFPNLEDGTKIKFTNMSDFCSISTKYVYDGTALTLY